MSAILGCSLIGVACGSDDGPPETPIQDIPPDKKLVDLNAAEEQGVCTWGRGIAAGKLPPAGTKLDCGGPQVTFNGFSQCGFPKSAQTGCEATVSQWETCFPAFVDRIAEDPCQILDLAFSQSRLEAFVDAIPGCEGLGPCSYTTS